jgi:hypothetical protein
MIETLTTIFAVTAIVALIAGFVGMTFDDDRDWPLKAMGLFVVSTLLALVGAFHLSSLQDDRYLSECMKDHKEYECVSMLRKHEDNMVVMPVVVSGR